LSGDKQLSGTDREIRASGSPFRESIEVKVGLYRIPAGVDDAIKRAGYKLLVAIF